MQSCLQSSVLLLLFFHSGLSFFVFVLVLGVFFPFSAETDTVPSSTFLAAAPNVTGATGATPATRPAAVRESQSGCESSRTDPATKAYPCGDCCADRSLDASSREAGSSSPADWQRGTTL